MFGKFIAYCLLRDLDVEADFTVSFLKHITGEHLYITDLADIDPELTKNLLHLLDISVEDLHLTYNHYETRMGEL